MALEGPVESTLKVFQTIHAYIQKNPGLMNTKGIFRISSSGFTHKELAEAIARGEKVNLNEFSPYDLVNALKVRLFENKLFPQGDERVRAFSEKLSAKDPGEEKSLFNDFMESLGDSEEDRMISEIYHIAIDISRLVALKEEHNSMSPNNLAIVWVPSIVNTLNLDLDPLAQLSFTTMLTEDFASMISMGLEKKLTEVVGLSRLAMEQAEAAFEVANQYINLASGKMTTIASKLGQAKETLASYEAKLKNKATPREQKKLIKTVIADLQSRVDSLSGQMRQNKEVAQRQLSVVVNHEKQMAGLRSSCDRLLHMEEENLLSRANRTMEQGAEPKARDMQAKLKALQFSQAGSSAAAASSSEGQEPAASAAESKEKKRKKRKHGKH